MFNKFLTTATENPEEVVETVEEVSELAQNIVDWFNKTNTKAVLIVGGIVIGVVLFGAFVVKPAIRKLRKR